MEKEKRYFVLLDNRIMVDGIQEDSIPFKEKTLAIWYAKDMISKAIAKEAVVFEEIFRG